MALRATCSKIANKILHTLSRATLAGRARVLGQVTWEARGRVMCGDVKDFGYSVAEAFYTSVFLHHRRPTEPIILGSPYLLLPSSTKED